MEMLKTLDSFTESFKPFLILFLLTNFKNLQLTYTS